MTPSVFQNQGAAILICKMVALFFTKKWYSTVLKKICFVVIVDYRLYLYQTSLKPTSGTVHNLRSDIQRCFTIEILSLRVVSLLKIKGLFYTT